MPTPQPTTAPTLNPTVSLNVSTAEPISVRYSSFYSSPCDNGWYCQAWNQVEVTGSGGLDVFSGLYSAPYLQYLQAFPSSGAIRVEGSLFRNFMCDDHFVYISIYSGEPYSSKSNVDGVLKLGWSCWTFSIVGPSLDISGSCSLFGTVSIAVTFSAGQTTFEAKTDDATCEALILSQGLEDIAAGGEDVYVYFGAEVDFGRGEGDDGNGQFARWLSFAATNALQYSTFTHSPCISDDAWACSTDFNATVSDGTLILSAKSPYSSTTKLVSTTLQYRQAYSSTRFVRVLASVELDSISKVMAVYISRKNNHAFEFYGDDRFNILYASKYGGVLMPTEPTSNRSFRPNAHDLWWVGNSSFGTYVIDMTIALNSSYVYMGSTDGYTVLNQTLINDSYPYGLIDFAPNQEELYYYIGGYLGYDDIKYHSLEVTNGLHISSFRYAPCDFAEAWDCTRGSRVTVNGNGSLLIQTASTHLQYFQMYSSLCTFRIEATIVTNAASNNHFAYLSVNSGQSWTSASTAGMIAITLNGSVPVIFGPSASSAGCSLPSFGNYTLQATITSSWTTFDATHDATCSASINQGLSDIAPSGERVYFYFGADPDGANASEWKSISIDGCPSDMRQAAPAPSMEPTRLPSEPPSVNPTPLATPQPSLTPSLEPTSGPTAVPSPDPSPVPTITPTSEPTKRPTSKPSSAPSLEPSTIPTGVPSFDPTTSKPRQRPTQDPTRSPTTTPSRNPTHGPTFGPTQCPTSRPASAPTSTPTATSTHEPVTTPTSLPTPAPSRIPTEPPTPEPTLVPTADPTTQAPTLIPRPAPTSVPTHAHTSSAEPTTEPTSQPTRRPSSGSSPVPTTPPSRMPSVSPSSRPSSCPSSMTTEAPTEAPTESPTSVPTTIPSFRPTSALSLAPTKATSFVPSSLPALSPTHVPILEPSTAPPEPSFEPTSSPTTGAPSLEKKL